ncbi:sp110 nuclear body protein isoform X2 [Erinaceus europaeus]|uniref:Sp110 nuclear body protein isoform X2 n=1 Tax=Erinaceus europaeus TaxID=9365 RepID=A0ABM3XLN7_ERIEU|nr:sp110 nuclear body protein isoform X2 [Erinaceus europaeus]
MQASCLQKDSAPSSGPCSDQPRPALYPRRGRNKVENSASRMFPISGVLKETLLHHFTCRKLEIAYAINKSFPFFESLRDRDLISEKMYRESLEACGNLVPLTRVVYRILTELEKTFNLSTLQVLFSQANLSQYPQLMTTFKSFKNVVTSYGGWSRPTATLVEITVDPAEGQSLQMPLPLPPPQYPVPSTPPHVPSEPGAATNHSTEILDQPPSPDAPADDLSRINQEGSLPVDELTSQISEESQDMPEVPPILAKGKKRKRSIWSTPKRRQRKKYPSRGATSPTHGLQEKKQVVDWTTKRKADATGESNVKTRTQEARTGYAQSTGPEDKRKKKSNCPSPKRRQSKRLLRRAASSDHRIQEKKRMVNQTTQRKTDSNGESKVMTRAQKARSECTQRP